MRAIRIALVSLAPCLALVSLGRAGSPEPLSLALSLSELSRREAATLDRDARAAVQSASRPDERPVLRLRHRELAARPAPVVRPPAAPAPRTDPSPIATPPAAPPPPTLPPAARPPRSPIAPPSTPRVIAEPPAAPPVTKHDLVPRVLEDAKKLLQRPGPPAHLPGTPPPAMPGPGAKPGDPRLHGAPGPKPAPKGSKQGPPPKQGGKAGPPPGPSGSGPGPMDPHPPTKQARPR
jgi:hypothetical protein